MKGCYSKGGKIRPKTIHGLRTGQHNNPNVLRAARANGGAVEAMHVDGEKPKMRMDKPMRRADGGRISDDSKREAERLKAKRDAEVMGSGGVMGAGLGALAGLGSSISRAGRVGRAIGAGLTGAGALMSAKALPENDTDREIDRIKAGRVKPGEEDGGPDVVRALGRKSGGSVKRARVKRADGGKAVQDDSGTDESTQRSYLKDKASKLRDASYGDAKSAAMNAGITAFNVTAPKFTRGMARTKNAIANTAAAGTGAIALGALKDSVTKQMDASTADKEAESFKKSGGAVKKGKC